MTCVAMTTPLQYVSGADEKVREKFLVCSRKFNSVFPVEVLRVFEAPANFVGNLSTISKVMLKSKVEMPLGASVPSLGLSNKAVYTCQLHHHDVIVYVL